MKGLIKNVIFKFADQIVKWSDQYRNEKKYRDFAIHPTVRLERVTLLGNVEISEHTYINEWSRITTGKNTTVKIGKHCAIGRNVHITSKTHDFKFPTTSSEIPSLLTVEKDTIIGNQVWIGDNVFIKEGITISDNAIIGANSVVTKNIEPFEIVAGVPAKHIRFNVQHNDYVQDLD